MTIKTGIDLVEIKDFKTLLQDPSFVERIFTQKELENKRPEHLAGIFATKEAFFKATQIKIHQWKEIEIRQKEPGKPYVIYSKDLLNSDIISIDLSISHTDNFATAVVVILI